MAYLLGVDLGTSSVKVALFEADTLRVIATTNQEYPVIHPHPGYAEQYPENWWQAVAHAIRTVMRDHNPDSVKGIGLDGQMHGLVCLDKDHNPVYPAIIWADTRSRKEVEELAELRNLSGATLPGPPAAGFAAASALWLSRYRPEVLKQTHVVLFPKDYLRLRLTGLEGTDPSDAAATWLFDIDSATWAPDIASFCGLEFSQLPQIRPSAKVFGELTRRSAEELGLPEGVPVITGCADLPAQALGHGVIEAETVLMTVGTGGQLLNPLDLLPNEMTESLNYFQHALPNLWYVQAAILSGGLALRWLRDLWGLRNRPDAYEYLSSKAASVPAGAEGLIFLPYLAGERAPHMDPLASGVFLGLRLHHNVGHIARAVMEGVGFALKDCLALVSSSPNKIILSGGITKSETWCQILADILGQPLQFTSPNVPRACLGSAILAGLGIGIFGDFHEAMGKREELVATVYPEMANSYLQRYKQYQRLYPLLRNEMHQL